MSRGADIRVISSCLPAMCAAITPPQAGEGCWEPAAPASLMHLPLLLRTRKDKPGALFAAAGPCSCRGRGEGCVQIEEWGAELCIRRTAIYRHCEQPWDSATSAAFSRGQSPRIALPLLLWKKILKILFHFGRHLKSKRF